MRPGKFITLLTWSLHKVLVGMNLTTVKAFQMKDFKQRIIYIPEYLVILFGSEKRKMISLWVHILSEFIFLQDLAMTLVWEKNKHWQYMEKKLMEGTLRIHMLILHALILLGMSPVKMELGICHISADVRIIYIISKLGSFYLNSQFDNTYLTWFLSQHILKIKCFDHQYHHRTWLHQCYENNSQ